MQIFDEFFDFLGRIECFSDEFSQLTDIEKNNIKKFCFNVARKNKIQSPGDFYLFMSEICKLLREKRIKKGSINGSLSVIENSVYEAGNIAVKKAEETVS